MTASLKAIGLCDSFGVDTAIPRLACPILQLDLLKKDHLTMLKELISSPSCVYVHLAPPCGTASRARLIQRKHCWNPPIVRTDQFPNGIPGLTGTLLARVQSANQLYQITCDLIRLCEDTGKLWSVENPGRSFMWNTTPFVNLIAELSPLSVSFHHCMYGSGRRKLTRFLHNLRHFADLEKLCNGQHEHEAWGQTPNGQWATSLEVAYPWDSCRTMAAKVALELQSLGTHCQVPCFAMQEATLQTMRAATEIQPRRHLPPMVSEFVEVRSHPVDQPLPPLSRRLSTQPAGVHIASASEKGGKFVTIGIHRSPEQFVEAALEIGHPTYVHSLFPDTMHRVVHKNVTSSQESLAQERTAELRRWAMLAEELSSENRRLMEDASARRADILAGKRLALMKRLLVDSGHQDTNLVDDITHGFDLTGPLPEANVFRKKFRPATIPCAELRKIAPSCRKALLSAVKSSGDPELDQGLMDATRKELNKGFIIGPLTEDALPISATLTRRFAVRQKNKIRPIDDYKSSMVNSSVSQSEGVSVHSIDHVAAMVALWMRVAGASGRSTGLKAKCWDLSDAYKQLPLSDHAFEHDSFLVVYDPDKPGPSIFQQKVLPFGSIASVTSFLRLSLAIWKLGTDCFI